MSDEVKSNQIRFSRSDQGFNRVESTFVGFTLTKSCHKVGNCLQKEGWNASTNLLQYWPRPDRTSVKSATAHPNTSLVGVDSTRSCLAEPSAHVRLW